MNKIFAGLVILIAVLLFNAQPASAADTLQLRPLMYKESLDVGESKRGVVDIANGSDQTAQVVLSVRFFRQTGDDGTLQFYDRPDETDGIVLDVSDIELSPKDAARIGFTVESSKLPQGDVFAAIFATTKSAGPNPADANKATGFFPNMKVSMAPWGRSTQFEGPLVYAGRTRAFDFSVPSSQFGIYQVTVGANGADDVRYVFLITGIWRQVVLYALLGLALIAMAAVAYYRLNRRHKQRKATNKQKSV
ncbi:MAG: hypothetical protein EOO17_05115 [Chloroflexi bacterium]|nr:MAG: hypothetical protein EOO17_05115 [Chloroflexota bacterium]